MHWVNWGWFEVIWSVHGWWMWSDFVSFGCVWMWYMGNDTFFALIMSSSISDDIEIWYNFMDAVMPKMTSVFLQDVMKFWMTPRCTLHFVCWEDYGSGFYFCLGSGFKSVGSFEALDHLCPSVYVYMRSIQFQSLQKKKKMKKETHLPPWIGSDSNLTLIRALITFDLSLNLHT